MLRSPVVLLLLLLASAWGQQPDCNLSESGALEDCITQLLEGLRNDVRTRSDPLRLDNKEDCRGRVCHTISNIKIHGLSGYNIQNITVSFPEGTSLSLKAKISWERLRGNFDARLKAEKRIWRKKFRASVSGKAEIRVDHPVGELDVTIRVDVNENGIITATPTNTVVTVRLNDIDVDVKLNHLGGFVDKLLGNPAGRIAELAANHFWKREWRSKVEQQAKRALERAIVEKLGAQLSELLHI